MGNSSSDTDPSMPHGEPDLKISQINGQYIVTLTFQQITKTHWLPRTLRFDIACGGIEIYVANSQLKRILGAKKRQTPLTEGLILEPGAPMPIPLVITIPLENVPSVNTIKQIPTEKWDYYRYNPENFILAEKNSSRDRYYLVVKWLKTAPYPQDQFQLENH